MYKYVCTGSDMLYPYEYNCCIVESFVLDTLNQPTVLPSKLPIKNEDEVFNETVGIRGLISDETAYTLMQCEIYSSTLRGCH